MFQMIYIYIYFYIYVLNFKDTSKTLFYTATGSFKEIKVLIFRKQFKRICYPVVRDDRVSNKNLFILRKL